MRMNQETNYPKLDELLGGLGNLVPGTAAPVPGTTDASTTPAEAPVDDDWEIFRKNLDLYNFRERKDERMICKLDRDLAESLDACDIDRKCRSDIVNAIVRTFVTRNLDRLRRHKRDNRSLLDRALDDGPV